MSVEQKKNRRQRQFKAEAHAKKKDKNLEDWSFLPLKLLGENGRPEG